MRSSSCTGGPLWPVMQKEQKRKHVVIDLWHSPWRNELFFLYFDANSVLVLKIVTLFASAFVVVGSFCIEVASKKNWNIIL